jgi:hypothetical protein
MKLEKLSEALKETTEKKRGTYVGVHFSKETNERIEKFIKDHDIPNPLNTDKLHTTIIYSRKYLPTFKADGELDPSWKGKPKQFEIFQSQDGSNCLVVLYDCKKAVERHEYIMKEYEATYDYPEFKTHFTLSYNVGELKAEDLDKFIDELGTIEVVKEYAEELNLDWAKKNTSDSE